MRTAGEEHAVHGDGGRLQTVDVLDLELPGEAQLRDGLDQARPRRLINAFVYVQDCKFCVAIQLHAGQPLGAPKLGEGTEDG